METEGEFADCESPLPRSSHGEELVETLDGRTIEHIVDWADQLSGEENDSARLEVFCYYCRFDSVPKALGDPEPPPAEEIIRKLDLGFYNNLGPEAPGTKCRKEECNRGTIQFSVFCRSHHFENVKRRRCPFQH